MTLLAQALARKRLRSCSHALTLDRLATMAEVARRAGVSMTTVSHVINGTRPASERTRRSVMAAIERTGYRPTLLARALARGGTQSLGLLISGLSNPYFIKPRAAVEQQAGGGDHDPLLGHQDE